MKKLFLTSSVHTVASDIAKRVDLSKGKKLVFIATAAEQKIKKGSNMTWLQNDRQALIDAGFDVEDCTITHKNLDQLKTDLPKYDFIYLSGGDCIYLLEQSHKSGFYNYIHELIKEQGKTYIGTSAGSIITASRLQEYYFDDPADNGEKYKGYGFINFAIAPHWGREDYRKKYLERRLELAYLENQILLLLLTDNQYVIVEDDQYQIVDVTIRK